MALSKRFEELDVWKKACRLTCRIYEATRETKFGRDFSLRDQIRRSALSIPSNIAEGFERNSRRVFANALSIAKGSSGELRTQIYIAARLGCLDAERSKQLVSEAEEISRMLAGFIKTVRKL